MSLFLFKKLPYSDRRKKQNYSIELKFNSFIGYIKK